MNNVNIKIMKDKPNLTDEEIYSHKDFEELLRMRTESGKGLFAPKTNWLGFTTWTVAVIGLVTTLVYFVSLKSEVGNDNIPTNNSSKVLNQDSVSSTKTIAIKEPIEKKTQSTPIKKEIISKKDNEAGTQPLKNSQFTQAEPVQGYPALYEYFNHELKYPEGMAKDSIEGVVTVSFAISGDGKPNQIKIANSLGKLFDQECLRVIENMPQWKPATINGKPTETRLSIPLTFTIKKN